MVRRNAILGISAYYHDSAAALVVDGKIIASVQEERFSRIKHDPAFPTRSIQYVLSEGGINLEDLSTIIFYEKPFLKFERLLETYHAFAPKGLRSFLHALPVWLKGKLFMKQQIRMELQNIGEVAAPIKFSEHHLSHAASAFYPSPFREAAILTIDGVGEWTTASIGKGSDSNIEVIKELHFPHSPGLLYSAFTYYLGFKVNSGEYKLMGLAAYGISDSEQTKGYKRKIQQHLVHIKEDGSIHLNMKYFDFASGLKMCNNRLWEGLFGIPVRKPESRITQEHMNLAMAIQQVVEEVIFRMASHTKEVTKSEYLVMSGGVALNCVAVGRLLRSGLYKEVWVQPAAGDAGGALGAALVAYYLEPGHSRIIDEPDSMGGACLGPEFSDKEIGRSVRKHGILNELFDNEDALISKTSQLISGGFIVGWFQGRMEFGPRALGNRSILADPRNPNTQQRINASIKFRENFRPFAPAVLEDCANDYFELNQPSPYMTLVADVTTNHRKLTVKETDFDMDILDRLRIVRSDFPAITHVDYSARIQTVNEQVNPRFYKLIRAFGNQSGYPMLVNTSFNVRGEPIVCTPDDAIRCFESTELDFLVIGNYILNKSKTYENPQMEDGISKLDFLKRDILCQDVLA